jgi:hypothetical protein
MTREVLTREVLTREVLMREVTRCYGQLTAARASQEYLRHQLKFADGLVVGT